MTKPTVLIVEDEVPLVTMLRYNLEKEGFQVCEAGDGEEALVQIAERKPDIVLLDWMLPLVSADCRRAHTPSSQGIKRVWGCRHRAHRPFGRLLDRPPRSTLGRGSLTRSHRLMDARWTNEPHRL